MVWACLWYSLQNLVHYRPLYNFLSLFLCSLCCVPWFCQRTRGPQPSRYAHVLPTSGKQKQRSRQRRVSPTKTICWWTTGIFKRKWNLCWYVLSSIADCGILIFHLIMLFMLFQSLSASSNPFAFALYASRKNMLCRSMCPKERIHIVRCDRYH